ncbi:MAG: hypothetical protein E6I43_01900 [Chloroflexi bacterium]|nr:MAG: hypothetical protein E6I43_01900 [Chloroflexota bacterium]
MRNADVAAMLNRVADLLEIRGENFFKIRAYREAVRQLDNLTTEVEDMIKEGRLKDVPGIGEAIEKKIVEYVTTGQLEFLTRLEAEIPPALLRARGRRANPPAALGPRHQSQDRGEHPQRHCHAQADRGPHLLP